MRHRELEESLPGPAPARPGLSVCCLTSGASPERTAVILELLRPLADEIVVAVELSGFDVAMAALAPVADRVLSYPLAGAGDRTIAWLFAQCKGEWILNVDDDEVPSEELLARLPGLLAADDVTHHWISRRWLFGEPGSCLDEPPWYPEYQLRLVRADRRFLQFSDEFHRPVIAHGPASFVDAPLWHLDFLLNGYERREAKALVYEHERRGMRIAGVSHNTGLYLPELNEAPRLAAVPAGDLRLIERALAGAGATPGSPRARPGHATAEDIERHWPGRALSDGAYHARLELRQPLATMRAGTQQTVDVAVENLGDRLWGWGKEAQPEIRLGYHWYTPDGARLEQEGLRTPFPAGLPPGGRALVPVHVVAPVSAGRYRLEIDLVHEFARWFACGVDTVVDVVPAPRVALAGDPARVGEILDAVALVPAAIPLLLEPGWPIPPQRFGHPRIPGLRSYLAHDSERTTSIGLVRDLLMRTRRLRSAALARRRGDPFTPLRHGADECIEQLAGCELLLLAGRDWPPTAPLTRELWRRAATVLIADALKVEVVTLGNDTLEAQGTIDRALVRFVRRRSRAVDLEWLRRRLEAAAYVSPTN